MCGPSESQNSLYVTVVVIMAQLALVSLLLLWEMWHWLLYVSIGQILVQLLLVIVVATCDPGIITKANKHLYT